MSVSHTPFYHTPQMLEIAGINAERYDWARSKYDEILKAASDSYDKFDGKNDVFVTKVKPLPGRVLCFLPCPACGKKQKWLTWSEDDPDVVSCNACKSVFPSADYPEHECTKDRWRGLSAYIDGEGRPYFFSHYIAYQKLSTVLNYMRLVQLGLAYRLSGEMKYAAYLKDMLLQFGEAYLQFPLCRVYDNTGEVNVSDASQLGTVYINKFHYAWSDTNLLQYACIALDLVADALEEEDMQRLADKVARPILEYNSLPNHYYLLDKFHNSSTCYMVSMALAGRLFGERLRVEDVVNGSFAFNGPDLVQDAVNGPRGARAFIETCFDREGIYFEYSWSYQGFSTSYLNVFFRAMKGYSDPEGYVPGGSAAKYYAPIVDFAGDRDIPRWTLAVRAPSDLHFPNMVAPAWNETSLKPYSGKGERPKPKSRNRDPLNRLMERQDVTPVEEEDITVPADRLVLKDASGQILLQQGSTACYTCWEAHQDYHSHYDDLNLAFFDEGRELVLDVGYHLRHPLRRSISVSTICHATVCVDQQNQLKAPKGSLNGAAATDFVSFSDVSKSQAYSQTSSYRRLLALVQLDENKSYLVDLFRVVGGRQHDWSLPAYGIDLNIDGIEMKEKPGTLAGEDVPYELPDYDVNDKTPFELLHNVRRSGVLGSSTPVHSFWRMTDSPEIRLHAVTEIEPSSEVIAVDMPWRKRSYEGGFREWINEDAVLLIRRKSEEGHLSSWFASALVADQADKSPVLSVRRLVQEDDLIVVEVSHTFGRDMIFWQLGDQERSVEVNGCRFTGKFGVVRFQGAEAVKAFVYGQGMIESGGRILETDNIFRSSVDKVDFESGRLHLADPAPEWLDGRIVTVKRRTGVDNHFIVGKPAQGCLPVDPSVSTLFDERFPLDHVEDGKKLVTNTGLPFSVENELIQLDHQVIKVEKMERSGLPIVDSGVTTNDMVRTVFLTLGGRPNGPLKPGESATHPAVTPGDTVTADPILLWSDEG